MTFTIIDSDGTAVVKIFPMFEVVPFVHVELRPANVPKFAVISPPTESNSFTGLLEERMSPVKVEFAMHELVFRVNFAESNYLYSTILR